MGGQANPSGGLGGSSDALVVARLNPRYGMTCWVNTNGTMWPDLPRDAFGFLGYRSNRCYVVPSLDLVVVCVGSGPTSWDEQDLIGRVVSAIVE